MTFLIICEPNDNLISFVEYIIHSMQEYVKDSSIYDSKEDLKWQTYLSENNFGWLKLPTIRNIVIGYANNLTYRQDYEGYSIYCDDRAKYDNSNISYYQLAAIINFGTLDLKAYPIIDKMIKYFEDKLLSLYELWEMTNHVNLTI